jgi:hypothetical protein
MSRSKNKASKPAARVLIVDDHPALREALAIRIAAQPDLEVCGEAADAAEALRLAASTAPGVASKGCESRYFRAFIRTSKGCFKG